jgi:hypothetical protein
MKSRVPRVAHLTDAGTHRKGAPFLAGGPLHRCVHLNEITGAPFLPRSLRQKWGFLTPPLP